MRTEISSSFYLVDSFLIYWEFHKWIHSTRSLLTIRIPSIPSVIRGMEHVHYRFVLSTNSKIYVKTTKIHKNKFNLLWYEEIFWFYSTFATYAMMRLWQKHGDPSAVSWQSSFFCLSYSRYRAIFDKYTERFRFSKILQFDGIYQ